MAHLETAELLMVLTLGKGMLLLRKAIRTQVINLINHLPLQLPLPGAASTLKDKLDNTAQDNRILGLVSMAKDKVIINQPQYNMPHKLHKHQRTLGNNHMNKAITLQAKGHQACILSRVLF
jgi:hypothetical protein